MVLSVFLINICAGYTLYCIECTESFWAGEADGIL